MTIINKVFLTEKYKFAIDTIELISDYKNKLIVEVSESKEIELYSLLNLFVEYYKKQSSYNLVLLLWMFIGKYIPQFGCTKFKEAFFGLWLKKYSPNV